MVADTLSACFKSRAALQLENLALRHQLGILRRSVNRPKLTPADRFLWAWLCEVRNDWRSSLVIVKPDTVIAWHRKSFRLFWTWKIRRGRPGRPAVPRNRSLGCDEKMTDTGVRTVTTATEYAASPSGSSHVATSCGSQEWRTYSRSG